MAALLLCSTAADPDKVAAAQEVLDRVAAASPAARAVVREMGDLIDGYIELVGCQVCPAWLCALACSCSAVCVYAPSHAGCSCAAEYQATRPAAAPPKLRFPRLPMAAQAAVPPPTKDAEEMAFPGGLRRSRQ